MTKPLVQQTAVRKLCARLWFYRHDPITRILQREWRRERHLRQTLAYLELTRAEFRQKQRTLSAEPLDLDEEES
jgi:hypothetical protein